MTNEVTDEARRLDTAIVAAEARLTRLFDNLLTRGEKGQETSALERHVATSAHELDRLRAVRAELPSSPEAEA